VAASQTVYLRRQHHTDVLVATALPGARPRRAQLMATLGPAHLTELAAALPDADRVVRVRGQAPDDTALLSLEVPADSGRMGLRSRWVSAPPPPLRALAVGDWDVSVPVLVFADAVEALARDGDPELTLARMRPGHQRDGARRVGVYWETYGLVADGLRHQALVIERTDAPGLWRRLGTRLGVLADRHGQVRVRWRDAGIIPTGAGNETAVPIGAHVVALEVAGLRRGSYRVGVEVTAADGRLVQRWTTFEAN
jgi:hypothetical protein